MYTVLSIVQCTLVYTLTVNPGTQNSTEYQYGSESKCDTAPGGRMHVAEFKRIHRTYIVRYRPLRLRWCRVNGWEEGRRARARDHGGGGAGGGGAGGAGGAGGGCVSPLCLLWGGGRSATLSLARRPSAALACCGCRVSEARALGQTGTSRCSVLTVSFAGDAVLISGYRDRAAEANERRGAAELLSC